MAWTTPTTRATGDLITASIWNTDLTENLKAGGEGHWLHDIAVFATAIAQTNFDTITADSAAVHAAEKTSSGAQNAEIGWDVVLVAGTWTVELIHLTANDNGIYSVQFAAVEKGTIDGYAAAAVRNVRSSVTGIAVATTAKTRVTLKMATKNASSSSYFGRINHVQLRRTA